MDDGNAGAVAALDDGVFYMVHNGDRTLTFSFRRAQDSLTINKAYSSPSQISVSAARRLFIASFTTNKADQHRRQGRGH